MMQRKANSCCWLWTLSEQRRGSGAFIDLLRRECLASVSYRATLDPVVWRGAPSRHSRSDVRPCSRIPQRFNNGMPHACGVVGSLCGILL